MSCMNIRVKCQSCGVYYVVMPSWHTKRGTTMEPKYPAILTRCKVCGGTNLMLSKPHGPLPERRGN